MSERVERAAEWVYGGVWRVLADGFRVPRTPPGLPADPGTVRAFHPSRAFLSYLKLYFWIALVAVDLALIALWVVVLVALGAGWAAALAPAFVILIVAPDVVAYVAIHLRYDTTWYVMSDRSLRVRRGVWVIREHTVTFENVQDVRVGRGPVEQLFGIARIVVETAGSAGGGGEEGEEAVENKAVMEGIDDPEAILALVMERVRASRSSGLGDEGRSAGGWTPGAMAALREVRDEARALASGRA